jgi:hypothetical protein
VKPFHKAIVGHARETIANTLVYHHKIRRTCRKTTESARSIENSNPLIISEMTFRLIDTRKRLEIAVTR